MIHQLQFYPINFTVKIGKHVTRWKESNNFRFSVQIILMHHDDCRHLSSYWMLERPLFVLTVVVNVMIQFIISMSETWISKIIIMFWAFVIHNNCYMFTVVLINKNNNFSIYVVISLLGHLNLWQLFGSPWYHKNLGN